MTARKHRNIHNVNKKKEDYTNHHAWNCLQSTSQRVGFWCQHIWFGFRRSKMTLSNNQSDATLWVLDWTSSIDDHFDHSLLVFGHRHLRFTLRRTCDCANVIQIWQLINISVTNLVLEFASSVLLLPGLMIFGHSRNVTLLSPHSIGQKQGFLPSQTIIQRNNVRFCGTARHWTFASCTNVRLPKIQKILPEFDLVSSRSPAKSQSWNKPNRQCWAVFPTWQHFWQSFVWWMSEIRRAKRLSQALVHFVHEQICLLTIKCTAYQFVPNTSMSRQSESILVTIVQLFPSPLSWGDGHPRKELTLCTTPLSFCLPAHSTFQRTISHDLPCRGTTRQFLREVSFTLAMFSVTSAEIRDPNIYL